MNNSIANYYPAFIVRMRPLLRVSTNLLQIFLFMSILSIFTYDGVYGQSEKSKIKKINKSTDENELLKYALTDNDYTVCIAAVDKITTQATIYKIINEALIWGVKNYALTKLTDQKMLAQVVMDIENSSFKEKAMSSLNDQEELCHIYKECANADMRKAAFNKLNDISLSNVIKESKDPSVILNAKIRLGQINTADSTIRKLANIDISIEDISFYAEAMSCTLRDLMLKYYTKRTPFYNLKISTEYPLKINLFHSLPGETEASGDFKNEYKGIHLSGQIAFGKSNIEYKTVQTKDQLPGSAQNLQWTKMSDLGYSVIENGNAIATVSNLSDKGIPIYFGGGSIVFTNSNNSGVFSEGTIIYFNISPFVFSNNKWIKR